MRDFLSLILNLIIVLVGIIAVFIWISFDDNISFYEIIIGIIIIGALIINYLRAHTKKIRKKFSGFKDFTPSYEYISMFSDSAIAIDTNSKQLCFHALGQFTKINFSELLSVEIAINGDTLSKTNRGSQVLGGAVGGLLLGPAGLLVGALSGSKTSIERVNKISIKILISNIDNPSFEIIFYSGPPIKSDSFSHNSVINETDTWIARLNAIIAMK